MRRLVAIWVFLLVFLVGWTQVPESQTLFIPRLEMFSTTYEIAFRGPAYIPLELEVKPKSWKRFSMYFVVGGYHQVSDHLIWSFFPRPTTRYKVKKGWQLGAGVRYYSGWLNPGPPSSPQGLYIQPTFNWLYALSGEVNPNSPGPDIFGSESSPIYLIHLGYQRRIKKWIIDGSIGYGYMPGAHRYFRFFHRDYLQPRISVGYVLSA